MDADASRRAWRRGALVEAELCPQSLDQDCRARESASVARGGKVRKSTVVVEADRVEVSTAILARRITFADGTRESAGREVVASALKIRERVQPTRQGRRRSREPARWLIEVLKYVDELEQVTIEALSWWEAV